MAKRVHAVPVYDEFPLDASLDFMRLLWSVEHGLQRVSKRMENEIGITGPQRLVLRIVGQFPDLSPKELAQIVHLHPSTITGVLQRLVDKSLLDRNNHPSDGRRVRLRVRREGKRFTSQATGTVEAAVGDALSRLPRDHVRRAREVLWAIAKALDETKS
ncbi:MAG: MarR family winged helix-turn-helix transcriptional regulator [Acidobacteriota bacterium]